MSSNTFSSDKILVKNFCIGEAKIQAPALQIISHFPSFPFLLTKQLTLFHEREGHGKCSKIFYGEGLSFHSNVDPRVLRIFCHQTIRLLGSNCPRVHLTLFHEREGHGNVPKYFMWKALAFIPMSIPESSGFFATKLYVY